MDYQYEILRLEPTQEYMSVLYTKSGCPSFSRNFNPSSFDQGTLDALINQGALDAAEFWERRANQPETVDIPLSGSGMAVSPVVDNFDPNYSPTIEPMPDYDTFTQRVELNMVEDPMQPTVGWTIYDLTAEEQVAILALWRSHAEVTPRQARLELAKRGLLANIDEIIALIPEPDKTTVQIEWEYAVSVERSSPWVVQLGSALGLDEEGLDDLFKAAAQL